MKKLYFSVLINCVLVSIASADYQVIWETSDRGFFPQFEITLDPFGNRQPVNRSVDLDGDKVVEFFFPRSGGGFDIVDAMTGSIEFTHPRAPGNLESNYFAFVDLDLDGTPEIVQELRDGQTPVIFRVIDYVRGGRLSTADIGQQSKITMQAFPNPMGVGATVVFSLEDAGEVDLKVLDVEGKLVKTIVNRTFVAGAHEVSWDGVSDAGQRLAAGTYFYKLTVDGRSVGTQKAVILK